MKDLLGYSSKKAIEQNLKDAGVDVMVIREFMYGIDRGISMKEILPLKKYRMKLVDELDERERKLRCLDYLLFQVRKSQ